MFDTFGSLRYMNNFSDSTVASVEEQVLSEEAYISFYAREGIPWFSTVIEIQKTGADPGISANVLVQNNTGCNADESKDIADKTSIQFSCGIQLKHEHDKPSDAFKWISRPLVSEPELHAAKSVVPEMIVPLMKLLYHQDQVIVLITLISLYLRCLILGKTRAIKAVLTKLQLIVLNFPWMPLISQCPDKRQRDSSVQMENKGMPPNPVPSRTLKQRVSMSLGGRRKYFPWLPRYSRGRRNESKLGKDLSSPGSVDIPKHVVIVMDGLQEFTTHLLEWALQNICASGHVVTLLGFMPWLNIPLSSKTWQDVWMLEFDHLSLRNEWKNDARYLKLLAVMRLCRFHGVTLQKEIVMGYPLPSLLAERIVSHRASWVIFDNDRYLRKNRAYFAKKIPCNMVMMGDEGYMDLIKGRPMIDTGDNTRSESPALVPTPLVICSEPLKRILEEQEYVDDYVI